jgi:hypothetical protein
MDPVTIGAVVAAIVSGAAGEAGGKLWDGLVSVVHRPFQGSAATTGMAAVVASGQAELAALEQAPSDECRAVALGEALLARAGADTAFQRELESWWAQASKVYIGQSTVTNTVSGGTQHGPVLQGRDFSGLTFMASPPQRPEE